MIQTGITIAIEGTHFRSISSLWLIGRHEQRIPSNFCGHVVHLVRATAEKVGKTRLFP